MFRTVAAVLLAATPLAAVAPQGWSTVRNNGEPMVDGSGRIVRQNRPVGNFDRLELKGLADVEVRLGASPSLSIQADDNLLPHLTSDVRGGTLVLGTRGSFRTRTTPRVWVTVPDLRMVESRGSGDVTIAGVSNRSLRLVSQGSGNMRASGRTEELDVTIQGSGDAEMRGLAAGKIKVAIQGSGNATVQTNGALDAAVYGSGTVRYGGRPSAIQTRRYGSGEVVALN